MISTSPPESLHVAAFLTARRLRCRWAADFRDHWLIYPLLREREGALRRGVEKRLAKSLLKRADLLFSPEQSMLDEVSVYAPQTPTLHLPQAALAAPSRSVRDHGPDEPIILLHSGSFSLSHDKRAIDPALGLLAEARARDKRFRLVLIGRLTADERAKAEAAAGVEIRGVQGLEETWRAQAEADVLLLVAAPDALTPPGKLAEYQAAGRPIVFIGGGAWRAQLTGDDAAPVDQLFKAVDAPASTAPPPSPTPEATAEKLLKAMQEVEDSAG